MLRGLLQGVAAYIIIFACSTAIASTVLPLYDDNIDVSDRYVVTLQGYADLARHLSAVEDLHAASLNDEDTDAAFQGITHRYEIDNFRGYAGHFNKTVIDQLRQHEDVHHVEPDRVWYSHDFESGDEDPGIHILDDDEVQAYEDQHHEDQNHKDQSHESHDPNHDVNLPWKFSPKKGGVPLVSQPNCPYNLALISHRDLDKLNEGYMYTPQGGPSYAYVVDSGIYEAHPEFQGRVKKGYNAAPGVSFTDYVGHGTHVAGIIGGKTFGVMKTATLVDVKVFANSAGVTSNIIDGYQWAVKDITKHRNQAHSVINISLGGRHYSIALSVAVRAGWFRGVSTVVAAGNSGAPSKWTSNAINVAATDRFRKRAWFSSFGARVSLFAPGVNITSSWVFRGRPAIATASGTSQAAPQAAGVVLYLKSQKMLPNAHASKNALLGLATKGVVKDPKSANLFLYNGSGR